MCNFCGGDTEASTAAYERARSEPADRLDRPTWDEAQADAVALGDLDGAA